MNIKGYAVLLAAIVIVGFAFISLVIFHDPVLVKQRPEMVYLDMDSMKEASDNIIGIRNGPVVSKIFPANHQNIKSDSIPWADAYLCNSINKRDSLTSDTLILLLDTKTDDKLYKIEYPEDYWTTDLKKARKFKQCRVVVSPEQLGRIKRARYKFVSVNLVTDDY